MKDAALYAQCELKNGTTHQVAYIPGQFAKVGKELSLRVDGRWDRGWIVEAVFESVPREHLPDVHDDVKQHRRNTGDNLPKKRQSTASR